MNQEIFGYGEDKAKRKLVYDDKLIKKIMHCIKYLEQYLPVNKLNADNTFDFTKLKFDEGKSYDWFFLTSEKATILVRQYRTHFTFFTIGKAEHCYFNKLNVFTMNDDFDKMPKDGSLNDKYCEDNFITLQQVLPQLVEAVVENNVGGLWNPRSFERPDFTDVKLGFTGEESVHSFDTLMFACDEIFQMYLVKYAENDTLERLKQLKVGDDIGGYTVASIKTEVGKDGYYYNTGLRMYRTADETKKENWADVYSLTRYYYEGLFYGNLKKKVQDFLFLNHEQVAEKIMPENILIIAQFTNPYIKEMHEQFIAQGNEIDIKVFVSFIPEGYIHFLEYGYRVKLKSLQK